MSETIKKMIRSEFDEEIEIPNISLENINKTLKEMDEITNEMLNPFDSVLDKMVKDIRDRQDNVMAMEFTKCIGELLRKNGVIPKITEYTREHVKEHSIEQLYAVSIDELDFSEHDKVFEDKIAELEKDYKTASELLGKYQQENESLKQRIDELEKELSSVVKEAERQEFIRDMFCLERQELNQRIAELESKKTEKPTKCTAVIVAKEINGQTYVTLDDFMSVVNDLQAKIGI